MLNAAPYHLTTRDRGSRARGAAHYLDLTEDVASTRRVKALAANAPVAFIPQCGLAPGFISIVAFDLAKRFETLDSVRLRVGALPQYPSNALNYNLTWSTDGVINEYCEPCEAIVNGVRRDVPPLEECEEFSLDGVTYEAFNTSGGLGTLCETLEGKVRNLNYRTIRYPGHAAIMKALLNDLRLRDRRDLLKDILENAVPATLQDVVIVFVTVCGRKDGQLVQETYANKIYAARSAAAPERDPDHHRGRDLRGARPAGERRAADQGLRPPGGHPARRSSWRTASAGSTPSRRAGRASASQGRDDDRARGHGAATRRCAILARLGVTDDAFARDGLAASSPITGETIATVRTADREGGRRRDRAGARPPSWPGERCRRRGAASWCACSARSCARPRPTSAAWSRSKPARSSPRASAKCRR